MDTIAAIATPPGVGALGVLRLTGPQAHAVSLAFLRLKTGEAGLTPRLAAKLGAHDAGSPLDQVVAVYFPGPNSATGEDIVEISCHGSPYILGRLLETAIKAGARMAAPGEFTQRAYLNGRLDLAQAEAVCDLIRARTDGSHRAALSQLEGGLSRAVSRHKEQILDLLIQIEAVLDHPEEDLPALSAASTRQGLREISRSILKLAETFKTGRLVSEGARVAIVGRSNAGKSSLFNALLGTDRAIVCPTPGTTRDTLEEAANLGGLPAVLIDTAGLREQAHEEAEIIGIERSERALRASDIALLVVDGSRTPDAEDERLHRRILETAAQLGRPVLKVRNKADLPSRLVPSPSDIPISALQRSGLEELVKQISGKLWQGAASGETVLVVSLRHSQALAAAAGCLEEAGAAISDYPNHWEDRAASHLRAALRGLGEIIGEGAPDEVLHGIFSRFCIGK